MTLKSKQKHPPKNKKQLITVDEARKLSSPSQQSMKGHCKKMDIGLNRRHVTEANVGQLALLQSSSSIYWHWAVVKESAVLLVGNQARSPGVSAQKAWTPQWLSGKVLIIGWGRGVLGCLIPSWTFFRFVESEVIRNQHHPASSSSWSGVSMLPGSI